MAADNSRFIDVAKQSGAHGREDFQKGWHEYVGKYFNDSTILDVGAGLGLSKERLKGSNNIVTLQDIAPGMPVDITVPVEEIPDNSYDVVATFDVIEHVVKDIGFLKNLIRIAKDFVVVTTPNFNVSGCGNPYHIREYTPQEMHQLVAGFDEVIYLAGSSHGERINILSRDQFLQHNHPHHGFIIKVDNK